MSRLLAVIFLFHLFCIVSTQSEVPIGEDFEIIDGIVFKKEELVRQVAVKPAVEAIELDEDENDQEYEEDDDDDDDDEEENEEVEAVKHLPTKCHVCRLLVVELEEKLKKIGKMKKVAQNGRPIYFKEEIVIRQVIGDLCKNMWSYNIRRKQPFRYVYGVDTKMRNELDKVTRTSKIKRWVFVTPEAEIDDPTGEIARLKEQCHQMLVDEQENLVHWFMKAQSRNLTQWFCEKRVLVEQNQDCLKLQLPKRRRKKSRENDYNDLTSQPHMREEL